MKRSIDQASSADADNAEESEMSASSFLLKSQNRSLSKEVSRNKRTLTEARKELDLMRRKAREMESLVSLIQRAWSQLDIDSCMLLDSLGDSDVGVSDEGCSELLHRLITTGSKYMYLDPTNIDHVPDIEADEWTSKEDIAKQREDLVSSIMESNSSTEQKIKKMKAGGDRNRNTSSKRVREVEGAAAGEDAASRHGGDENAGSGEAMQIEENESKDAATEQDSSRREEKVGSGKEADKDRDGTGEEDVDEGDDAADDQYEAQAQAQVEENLRAHVSFTLSLLERLCTAISECEEVNIQIDSVNALSDIRDLRAERLFLSDKIAKLSVELVDLRAQLRRTENDKTNREKELDKALLSVKELEQRVASSRSGSVGSTGQAAASAGSGNAAAGAAGSDAGASTQSTGDGGGQGGSGGVGNSSVMEREMQQQIELLEKQLSESEAARAKVELTLTERLARPMAQTETQVKDMRDAMEELRQQAKQRVNALIAEGEKLQEKVRNMELAMLQLEAVSAARIDEVVTATEQKVAAVTAEKDALRTKLCAAEADLHVMQSMRRQLAEYGTLEELCNSELAKLQHQVKLLHSTQGILQQDLNRAREREAELELVALDKLQQKIEAGDVVDGAPTTAAAAEGTDATEVTTPATTAFDSDGGSNDPNISSAASIPQTFKLSEAQLVVKTSHERVADLQRELEDARSNINDLILEIEAVSNDAVRAREQGGNLLTQVTEIQAMQRSALEENLILQNQIEDMKTSKRDIEAKLDLIKAAMSQQEALVAQQRHSEHGLRNELMGLKKSGSEIQNSRHREGQQLLELKHDTADKQHEVESVLKRNAELQRRCEELSRQCDIERKSRMELQKESLKDKQKKSKSSSSGGKGGSNSSSSNSNDGGRKSGDNPEDSDMLEMTLGMLRCSVCKDRFKSAAITRCYHLFCRECIDENLRNRSRKCPACGEKFGQDDVTNIYFN